MNAIRQVTGRYFLSSTLAAAVAMFSSVGSAGDVSSAVAEQGVWSSSEVAYNAKRWPAHTKVHRSQKREKAEFARFEEKTGADNAMAERTKKPRGYHRRAPYSKRAR